MQLGQCLRQWKCLSLSARSPTLRPTARHPARCQNVLSTLAASGPDVAQGIQRHQPVLLSSVVQAYSNSKLVTFVDGTLGAGGHSAALAAAHTELQRLVGIDADPTALQLADLELAAARSRGVAVSLVQGNFADLCQILQHRAVQEVDGILLDIGVSSMQLDTAERGFSFSRPGPLDMRMGPAAAASAADLVNTLPEEELGRLFREYGEERHWRKLARNLCEARNQASVQSTEQLISALRLPPRPRPVKGRGQKQIHPATRVFQALRIAVNNELAVLQSVIPQAIQCMRPGARLAIITFHSLEDRLVKQAFKAAAGLTPAQGEAGLSMYLTDAEVQRARAQPTVALITRKPITASEEECQANPRSRSAKLRVVEKV